MTGLELALDIGRKIASTVLTTWLAGRRRDRDSRLPLSQLAEVHISDMMLRREFSRKSEQLVDAVANRIRPLCDAEYKELSENERLASLNLAVEALEKINLSDQAILKADANAGGIEKSILAIIGSRIDELSEGGQRFLRLIVHESAVSITQMIVHLPAFDGRVNAETLQRLSIQSDSISQILSRLPITRLNAPLGDQHDDEFRAAYFKQISDTQDEIELFGVETRRERPRLVLSVAYISLSVEESAEDLQSFHTDRDIEAEAESGSEFLGDTIEAALSSAKRLLLRGEAGCGKSTLMRWLAISAVRAKFGKPLLEWNGLTPFLVKLRSYADGRLPRPEELLNGIADPIVGIMPAGWVHRQLASGSAVLLVDGVDELPSNRRNSVRKWLESLVYTYPDMRVIVTSRPAAARNSWLDSIGFTPASLQRMNLPEIRSLIRHWHAAIREAPNLPCSIDELPIFESSLLAKISRNEHLRILASSPLLCSMLCALNLDRDMQLPRNRLGLYEAAVSLLVQRRDVERQVPNTLGALELREKLKLLQCIAYWLTRNSRAEISRDLAEEQLKIRLAGMPIPDFSAEEVLNYLLTRSGVLRSPAEGRVDFVHRTFQDYLASREAAEQGDAGLLVQHAHLDSWRDVVIMAAGAESVPFCRELISDLIERSRVKSRHTRALRLLVATCLETITSLDSPELLQSMEGCLKDLLPPKSSGEVPALSGLGERVIQYISNDLSEYSEAVSLACVKLAGSVRGDAALDLLGQYMTDSRERIRENVMLEWSNFDPAEFALKVLAPNVTADTVVPITHESQISAASLANSAYGFDIYIPGEMSEQGFRSVCTLPLSSLRSGIPSTGLLELLGGSRLSALDLSGGGESITGHLPALPQLRELSLRNFRAKNFNFLRNFEGIEQFLFGTCSLISDWSQISRMTSLRDIHFYGVASFDFSTLVTLKRLRVLKLTAASPMSVAGLRDFSRSATNLENLVFHAPEFPNLRIAELATISSLRALSILGHLDSDLDLTHLSGLKKLRELALETLPSLETLSHLPNLTTLQITDPPETLDLSPIIGRRLNLMLGGSSELLGEEEFNESGGITRF